MIDLYIYITKLAVLGYWFVVMKARDISVGLVTKELLALVRLIPRATILESNRSKRIIKYIFYIYIRQLSKHPTVFEYAHDYLDRGIK